MPMMKSKPVSTNNGYLLGIMHYDVHVSFKIIPKQSVVEYLPL